LRFGSSHESILNCIYKIIERKVKFNAVVKLRRKERIDWREPTARLALD
jgi:hypothetical protein